MKPDAIYVPAIIRFLGYNPLPPAKGIGEQLVRHRTTMGITQKMVAEIGVDPTALARWEHGEKEPTSVLKARVNSFLEGYMAQYS